jgi:hypothetical protein
MTFEELLRRYRCHEALALYDAYYERMANLKGSNESLGDDLPIAWVPIIFHCTYFDSFKKILEDGFISPGRGKECVSFTDLSVVELTRFRTLRKKPFEVAIGFPRASLEVKGLFQPAYLKHASDAVKERFKDLPSGYVELDDDLGALHEVRVPGNVSINDAVWVLTSDRYKETKIPGIPGVDSNKMRGLSVSFWHPSHQAGMIREPVFRMVTWDKEGKLTSLKTCGKHYMTKSKDFVEKMVNPPAGNSFKLRFPKELRNDTLKDGWEGPFSKFEMAEFCYKELKKQFPDRVAEIRPRINL